jgi:hypothetical protein
MKPLFSKKTSVYMVGLGILLVLIFVTSVTVQENLVVRNRISDMVQNKLQPQPQPQPQPTPAPIKPPQYFTSCGDATQYDCNTCLNAVISNAPSVKCGWTDTGHKVNGNQKQYICESGGSRTCPK